MGRTLYFVAGEHSGDARGAELMAALTERRPDWKYRGLGGPQMAELAGEGLRDWVEEAAVVGIWEVVKRFRWFKTRFAETCREIEALDPDAVIFVDYPGFNLRLAGALRQGGSEAKLIDYVAPQVWAWNKSRLPRLARWLDLMLCLFPFEKELFESAGLKTVCMGHPMVDQLEAVRVEGKRDKNLVGMFPGSRDREVERIFPVMVGVVRHLHELHPEWTFQASAASEAMQRIMRRVMEEEDAGRLPIEIVRDQTYELMQRARCGVVASGTATLEATYYGLPYCLVYKVPWPTAFGVRTFLDVEHLGMANILAGREVVHEFIQGEANVGNISSFVECVMTDPVRRKELERDLLDTAALLGGGGAAGRAADAIVELMESNGS